MKVVFEIEAKDFNIAEGLARVFLAQADRFGFEIIQPLVNRTARTHVDKYPGLSGIYYKLTFFVVGVKNFADQNFQRFLALAELNSSFTLIEPKLPSTRSMSITHSATSDSSMPGGLSDDRLRELGIPIDDHLQDTTPAITSDRRRELGI